MNDEERVAFGPPNSCCLDKSNERLLLVEKFIIFIQYVSQGTVTSFIRPLCKNRIRNGLLKTDEKKVDKLRWPERHFHADEHLWNLSIEAIVFLRESRDSWDDSYWREEREREGDREKDGRKTEVISLPMDPAVYGGQRFPDCGDHF